jgi:hypothetical protein
MYVNRRTYIAQKGKLEEAANFEKEFIQRMGPAHAHRVYVSEVGPFDTLAEELEFETLAEYERFIAEVMSKATAEDLAKWDSLTLTGGINEIWQLR